jgi:type IV secretory pathway VirB2 component (pilin)
MKFISFILAAVLAVVGIVLTGYAVTHYNPWLNMISLIGGISALGASYITIMHIMGDLS